MSWELTDHWTLAAIRGLTLVLVLLAAWSSPAAPWSSGGLGWLLGQLTRAGYVVLTFGYAMLVIGEAPSTSGLALILHLGTWLICIAQIARRGAWVRRQPLN